MPSHQQLPHVRGHSQNEQTENRHLKTRMQQETLTNLLRVKGTTTTMKEFDPDPAIDHWLLNTKTRRHILSIGTPSPSISHIKEGGQTEHVRQPHQEFPPLPHVEDQSDEESASD